jgi:hypothetical protein
VSTLRKRILFACAALTAVWTGARTGDGAITIEMPSSAQTFFTYSNIETSGLTDGGVDVWITISLGGTVGASATEQEEEATWYHDFAAPTNGWAPPSGAWKAKVYDDNDHTNEKDWVVFEILSPDEEA